MLNLQKTCEELYDQFLTRLGDNEARAGILMEKTNNAITICIDFLDQLKVLASKHIFLTKAEEVHFFKVIKPRFSSQAIYYTYFQKFYAKWPSGSRHLQNKHVKEALNTISKFYHSNKSLYEYYRAGHTYLDDQFFVRSGNSPWLFYSFIFNDIDRTFCTSHDGKIAMILAYDMLEVHLQDKLDEIENGAAKMPVKKKLTWNETKNAFVELVYGIEIMQTFLEKHATVKEIANQLGGLWNINVDDEIYRIYQELCRRKSGRTKFLDLMREKLQNRMDKDFEN